MSTRIELVNETRRHIYTNNAAALATLSLDETTRGFPFGSIVPYAVDEQGRPLIFISDIAQHTRNVIADPRASLLVSELGRDDPQSGWRATLLGSLERLGDDSELDYALHWELDWARYVAQVPAARSYSDTHGFGLWRMEIARVRFIGGFGKIHWIEPADYLREPGHSGFDEAAAPIIEHMNSDHADALIDYCKGLRGFTPESAEMVGVEAAGFFLRTREPDDLVYFPFGEEIDADDTRTKLIELLKQARS